MPAAHSATAIKRVPEEYLALRGSHAAHPGTGKGFRATSRVGSIDVYAEEILQLGAQTPLDELTSPISASVGHSVLPGRRLCRIA
jgi:hypothetical protein